MAKKNKTAGGREPMVSSGAAIELIPLKLLMESEYNERRRALYDVKGLEELTESVRAEGVLQPLLVRPVGKKYEIVFGERRYRAARAAGLEKVRATVAELTDQQARALCLAENVQREQLPLSVEAASVCDLLESGMTTQEASAYLGKPLNWVAFRQRIAGLIDPILALVDEHGTPGQWELVARLTADQQQNLYDRELSEEWGLNEFLQNSVADLRESLLSTYTMALKNVPWEMDDETLILTAGACAACPKRSSACCELFPELVSGKDDTCLDKDCFAQKQAAFTARRIERLRAKHPSAKLVATVYADAKDGIPYTYKSDLTANQVPKVTPGAVPVLDVSTGKVFYQRAEDAGADEPTKLVKPTTLSERRAFLELRRWKHVADALCVADGDLRAENCIQDLEAVFAQFMILGVHYLGTELSLNPSYKEPASLESKYLIREALLHGTGWLKPISFATAKDVQVEAVQAYGAFFGIDLAPLKRAADEAIPEPKSWARLPDDSVAPAGISSSDEE